VTTLLDVGCGAGTAALIAARAGAQSLGTDIDGRALAFASVNALVNDLNAVFLEGDLYAGVREEFACVCFNAPLVRASLAGDDDEAPLYARSVRGEALAMEFLAGARARTSAAGEALCHVQLTSAITDAVRNSGFARAIELHFADAADGTPHALVSLRGGEAVRYGGSVRYNGRVRVPIGPALPTLRREALDRLHATAEVLAGDDATLRAAVLRPPPWLLLTRTATHDGGGFRPRALRFGRASIEPEDLALLESCDGRPLGELAPSDEQLWRARELAERGLLVV
jgi:SAM-dependent methyltransferase